MVVIAKTTGGANWTGTGWSEEIPAKQFQTAREARYDVELEFWITSVSYEYHLETI